MTTQTTTAKARRSHFEFALWATTFAKPPTVRQIVDRFKVSYETARAWRNDWIDTCVTAVTGAARSLHAKG